MRPFADTYRNRRVLVTGHTGFKGSWLVVWLAQNLAPTIHTQGLTATDRTACSVGGSDKAGLQVRDCCGSTAQPQITTAQLPK